MRDKNGKPFIATLYNVLLSPSYSVHVTTKITRWHYRTAHKKNSLLVKRKEKSRPQNQIPKKRVSLRLLHQRLGHRSTRSLLDWDTEFFWQDIELRVDHYPFFTPCQIYAINKESISKTPLKAKAPFKWVFMGIIPAIS